MAIARRGVQTVGLHQVITGDCLTVMDTLPMASFDVVVTSPPYNLGIKYSTYDDTTPRSAYLLWMQHVCAGIHRVMEPTGSLFLNMGATNLDPWVADDVAAIFAQRFALQNRIVWVKSISIGEVTHGHFKPINSGRFLNHNHETIYHFTKSGKVEINRLAVGVPYADKSNIARRGHAMDMRCAGDVWFIPYETVQHHQEKFNHPAGFPCELPRRCIALHGRPGGRVLDPFMGSGTTLVAAQFQNCQGTGIEVDPDYARAAAARVKLAL